MMTWCQYLSNWKKEDVAKFGGKLSNSGWEQQIQRSKGGKDLGESNGKLVQDVGSKGTEVRLCKLYKQGKDFGLYLK